MEVFGKFWNIVVVFLLIFIAPIQLANIRRQFANDIRLISEVDYFLDNIRYKGYLDQDTLQSFLDSLSKTNSRKFYMIHHKRAVQPIIKNGETEDIREFFLEVGYEEIKEILKQQGKYRFKIGDKLVVRVFEEERGFPNIGRERIEMGGMIENELDES